MTTYFLRFQFRKYYICCLLILLAVECNAQAPYHKRIAPLPGSNHLSNIVYVAGVDSSCLLVGNKGIITLNTNTGSIYSAKELNMLVASFNITAAFETGDILYLSGVSGGTEDTSWIIKLHKPSHTIVWHKKIQSLSGPINATGLTGDHNGMLYILGSLSDAGSGNHSIAILKIDTGGMFLWAKSLAVSTTDEYPSCIHYSGERELYVTSTGYVSPFGRALALRLDSSGNILNTNLIVSTSGPRLGGGSSCIANGKLYTMERTIIGPSDPGPVLVRVLDSTLTTIHTKIFTGMLPSGISANGNAILISGQAMVSSGLPGFRTVRMDTTLNTIGAAYFNKIPTFSIAANAKGFLNTANESFHFFKMSASDTIDMVKTDISERVNCNDTSFNPAITVFAYADSPYLHTESPMSVTISDITTSSFSNMSLVTIPKCPFPQGVSDLPQSVGLSIYPNPVSSVLNIHVPDKSAYKLYIHNMLGENVLSTTNLSNIDVSMLAHGVYIVQAISDNHSYFGKFRKE